MWSSANFFSFEGCPHPDVFRGVEYPWEVLAQIPDLIAEILRSNPGKYRRIGAEIWIGQNTSVAEGAALQGPLLIGDDCEIRPNAFLRGNVIIGDDVVVGNASEVKQSVLFSGVRLPHYNYVGDSILGFKAHLGAGSIASNFKSVAGQVKVRYGEHVLETGLRKLGAILGDGVEVGCNAVLNPGTVIGPGSVVYPLVSVRGFIPGGMILKERGELVRRV